ncbi:MAG TPA: response regulator transcription factor [Actinomycetota bacterium]|nr:response regulator transcription factor [Actinomycetota bacterium]
MRRAVTGAIITHMVGDRSALLRGEQALEAGDWESARSAFEAALAEGEDPIAEDGLGRSLWWLGDPDGAMEHRERAYVLYKGSDPRRAGTVAIWLAREQLSVNGNEAAANGWLARAERMLGDGGHERGWLEIARGRRSGDPSERERRAKVALELGREAGDADLEVAALAELGLAEIQTGRVPDGLDHLDEAMAAATGGEADMLETVAEACCSLVAACELAGDAGRLEQWARIVDRFVSRREGVPLLAFCRTCNAEMLAATGHREQAELELLGSVAALGAGGHRSRCVDPAVKLAEVRLRQGRLEEAAALLEGREHLPEAVLPAAELDLARGEPALASARLLRRLNLVGREGMLGAPLLARLVEVQIAARDLDAARASSADLSKAADGSGHPMIAAYARMAEGRVAAAGDEPAAEAFERAADRFGKLELGSEAARARLALAEALRDEQPKVALAEARSALEAFEALGAVVEADRAAALIRDLGGPARTGPKALGLLTKREREVLALLGEGLSNPEIAARLFISTKTAEHHVSNILAKLNLRTRTEAAALSVRHLGEIPPER